MVGHGWVATVGVNGVAQWSRLGYKDELVTADLDDARLDQRFALLLSALGQRPNLSIPAACGGRAEMTAAYRFFDNPKVTFAKVLRPHADRTRQRLAGQPVALLVQDTTEADVTRPESVVRGAGELDGARRGFLVHALHAFTPEGTPLGTVWAEVINRTGGVSHARRPRRSRRRSHTPSRTRRACAGSPGCKRPGNVAEHLPGVNCVCVADSEADIYELLTEPRGPAARADPRLPGPGRGHGGGATCARRCDRARCWYTVARRSGAARPRRRPSGAAGGQNRQGRQATVEVGPRRDSAPAVAVRPRPAGGTVNVLRSRPNPPRASRRWSGCMVQRAARLGEQFIDVGLAVGHAHAVHPGQVLGHVRAFCSPVSQRRLSLSSKGVCFFSCSFAAFGACERLPCG